MITFLITLAAFVLFVALAAIGVMLGRPAIKGSCGGLGRFGIQCDGGCDRPCPNRQAKLVDEKTLRS